LQLLLAAGCCGDASVGSHAQGRRLAIQQGLVVTGQRRTIQCGQGHSRLGVCHVGLGRGRTCSALPHIRLLKVPLLVLMAPVLLPSQGPEITRSGCASRQKRVWVV